MTRLRKKVAGLQSMVATIQTLAYCCASNHRPNCPILRDSEEAPPVFGRA